MCSCWWYANSITYDAPCGEFGQGTDFVCSTAAAPAYTFVRARRSWADARADCQSRGSDLATITTVEENAAAFAAVTAGGGYINGGVGTWIGLNDQAQEATGCGRTAQRPRTATGRAT